MIEASTSFGWMRLTAQDVAIWTVGEICPLRR